MAASFLKVLEEPLALELMPPSGKPDDGNDAESDENQKLNHVSPPTFNVGVYATARKMNGA